MKRLIGSLILLIVMSFVLGWFKTHSIETWWFPILAAWAWIVGIFSVLATIFSFLFWVSDNYTI